jgi:hypothetical protein
MTNSPSAGALSLFPVAEKTIEPKKEKPRLTVVPSPDSPPQPEELLVLYRAQKRDCWLCKKIAGDMEGGRKVAEDDQWHFTSCVLSWENLSTLP